MSDYKNLIYDGNQFRIIDSAELQDDEAYIHAPEETLITLLPVFNAHKDDDIVYWGVKTSNPYYSSRFDSEDYFLFEDEADDQYDEYCTNQGGRSSFNDDDGGLDYSVEEYYSPLHEMFYLFGVVDWLIFFQIE